MSRTNAFLTIAFFLLLLGGLFYQIIGKPNKDKGNNELGVLLGNRVPEFTLPILNSPESLTADKLQNNSKEFILLNFYASWCNTCDIDHKELMKLVENKKLSIYGVMSRDSIKKSVEWLQKEGNPYDLIAVDRFGRMKKTFKLIGIPESFLINRDNIIIAHFRGPISVKRIDEIITSYEQRD